MCIQLFVSQVMTSLYIFKKNLIFQIKPFFYMTKKPRQKLKCLLNILRTKRAFKVKKTHFLLFLTLFRIPKSSPTILSPTTSTNVGISPKNYLTFSFNPFSAVVLNFQTISRRDKHGKQYIVSPADKEAIISCINFSVLSMHIIASLRLIKSIFRQILT